MWRVAHLDLDKCLDVLEFHSRVYLHGEGLAHVVDERELHRLQACGLESGWLLL